MADLTRKTANLFDKYGNYSVGTYTNNYTITGLKPNTQYTCSTNFTKTVFTASIYFGGGSSTTNGVWAGSPNTRTSTAEGTILLSLRFRSAEGAPPVYDDVIAGTIWIMVNEGSTTLPYEPYGWVHSLRELTTATDTFTTLPVDVYADGNNATVGLKGNTVQSGTPTPENPIMPEGTGERTGNLCPMIFSHKGVVNDNGSVSVQNTRLWTDMIPVSASSSYYVAINGKASNDEVLRFNRAIQYDASGTFISRIDTGASITTTFTTAANCAYIVLDIRTMSLNVDLSEI